MSVVGLLTAVLPVSAQKVVLQKGEYWLDGDFDNRTSIALTDKWETELDVSSLCEGIHTLGFRASDSEGRWSSPNVHYFLRSGRTIEGNQPASYELWIDDDFDHRTTGVLTDGTADMELDLARLHTGLHRLTLRVKDTQGLWSTPMVRFFAVPDTLPAENAIGGYSYWFNRGPRIRITTAPANPLEIVDLTVEIKDVVPNEIPADYRFDVGTKTVYCNDNVFFGIEAYDLAGRSTQAVLSDTFPMTVPVRIDFRELENGHPRNLRRSASRTHRRLLHASRCRRYLDMDGKQRLRRRFLYGKGRANKCGKANGHRRSDNISNECREQNDLCPRASRPNDSC